MELAPPHESAVIALVMQQYMSDECMHPGLSNEISYLSLLTHVRDAQHVEEAVGGDVLSPYTRLPFTSVDVAPRGFPPLLTAPWMILTSLSHEASDPLKYDPRIQMPVRVCRQVMNSCCDGALVTSLPSTGFTTFTSSQVACEPGGMKSSSRRTE